MEKKQIPEDPIELEISAMDASALGGELFERVNSVMKTSRQAAISVQLVGKPVFYCITPELYRELDDHLENKALKKMVNERKDDPSIKVDINDL